MFTKIGSRLLVIFILVGILIPMAGINVNSVSAAGYCDWVQYVADVTVPDGTNFRPGDPFIKTWRLKNIGSCTWTTAYTFVFSSGEKMSGPASISLPKNVAPGQTIDISVPLVAPASVGAYRGFWKLLNASGAPFGIGIFASNSVWVDILVVSSTVVAFDFTQNICYARWIYDGGPVPCPFKPTMVKYGEATVFQSPILENGLPSGKPSILTAPQQKFNGFIHGIFPVFDIKRGDHFQTVVGCEYGATSCQVIFQLEYLGPSDELVTIWKSKEKYDGKLTRVDVDLSSFSARGHIRFVLTASAIGRPAGARPFWVQPVIVRDVPIIAPPTLAPLSIMSMQSASCEDAATFVTDVTIPDGTILAPSSSFTKTWRVQNSGSCTWTTDYSLFFSSGEKMGSLDSVPMPGPVAPGQTVDLSVNLSASARAGTYQGNWMLRNPAGTSFDPQLIAKINVASNTPLPVASGWYDFYTNICSAQWQSSAGSLLCPGTDGDVRGFVLSQPTSNLETGTMSAAPALLTFPDASSNGYIRGVYPDYFIQAGDHFQATISCEANQPDCNTVYEIGYQVGSGPIQSIGLFVKRYDGQSYNVDLDLSYFAGQTVKFVLAAYSNGSAVGDRALWISPHIVNILNAAPTNTPTPTFTLEPPPTMIVTNTVVPIATDTVTLTPSP